MIWKTTLVVALGGALGSALRYLVTQQMLRVSAGFPVGTLVVNVVGCFLIGLFARVFSGPESNSLTRAALTVGFCGGFTTFSTFSAELLLLVEQGRTLRALMYVGSSTLIGMMATVAGLSLGARLAANSARDVIA